MTKEADFKKAEAEAKALASNMRRYRLMSAYWDNRVLHPIKSIVSFPEGTAPKGSILLED